VGNRMPESQTFVEQQARQAGAHPAQAAAAVPKLCVRSVTKTFPSPECAGTFVALDNVSTEIGREEFVCLVGPSGCGKTTLLNLIAGFVEQTSGQLLVDGQPIKGASSDRGVVFQDYALFPWLTIRKNVQFGPRVRNVPLPEREAQADKYLEMVGLSEFAGRYLNGDNEEEVARVARKTWKHVSVSHEVSPEAREYERTLVTALNASLLPKMEGLVASLKKSNIPEERLHLFHSAGGMVSAETASRFPLLLAMSGPAAGVEAASAVAASLKLPYAITFDMGGTTTDCSLIVNGRAELQMEGHIGKYAVRQPMVAVESIGAGGGSIVRLHEGSLRIGPDSAGANPGPACYNRGGEFPTIADAIAIVGYFGRGNASERPIAIDRDAAMRAFSGIAKDLGLSPEDAALGALRVANAVASRAIKRITMGRGIDARSCVLIAFGGAGPMLACLLAGEMGIRKVVVPFRSSALSALGCLSAEPRFTRQRTTNIKRDEFSSSSIEAVLTELERVVLGELVGGHVAGAGARVEHVALMRYAGQSYEIEIPIARPVTKAAMGEAFSRKHQSTYGYAVDEPWECVGFRTTGIGVAKATESLKAKAPERGSARAGSASAYFQGIGRCDVTEYRRNDIAEMERIPGPAIIVDEFSTILIPHGWTAKAEHGAHICIENEAG